MKLVRYGEAGRELPGILDAQGRIRALAPAVRDITPEVISDEGLAVLRALDTEKLPLVQGNPRLGPPVVGSRQFVGVGLNYANHAKEAGLEVPTQPVVFTKAPTSISGANDDIIIHAGAQNVDWEVELGFVIGRAAWQVSQSQALDHVAGYFTANDVSERDWQIKRGGQFLKGKSAPTFGPVGPWLVTRDEVPDPQNLALSLQVNGKPCQNGHTSDMLFGVAVLIEHLSTFFRLEPGDLVITGTPAGVGMGMKPPVYLKPGDVVTLEVQGLGRQTQHVKAAV